MKSTDLRNRFKNAIRTHQTTSHLIDEFDQASESDLQHWAALIDESPYSLNDWSEALLCLKAWEANEKRTLTLVHRFEYLSCCAASASNFPHLISLPNLLKSFLASHGVE